MLLSELIQYFEEIAPPALQESYDNSGLLTGNQEKEVHSSIVCIDITENIVDEAIQNNSNLIISHHPLVFNGLKNFTGKTYTERTLIKAIQNNIAIYSLHTNFDAAKNGVNWKICEKLNLKNITPLSPYENYLKKLVTFVPIQYAENVRKALFSAGAGNIGNYDSCSYSTEGNGTFKANEHATPFVGKKNEIHTEQEIRIETIYPKHIQNKLINALIQSHPYEEVAYDIYAIENTWEQASIGLVGELVNPMKELELLQYVKNIFKAKCIRHTELLNKEVKKIAVCGGSGSSLLKKAISKKADLFVTADFKYHNFFDAENKIVIADIGHFESEQFTKELIFDIVSKKFPNFAIRLSETEKNPVNYL